MTCPPLRDNYDEETSEENQTWVRNFLAHPQKSEVGRQRGTAWYSDLPVKDTPCR